ncbi:LysE family translocator [Oceanospirillum maris]|uniref:LysE family translocator n=1 Tax=Oceanospirillum maris TaxID=64977 RepID=UPI0003FD12F9|nr:LysE family translocator [Oceanospirillum maris]
MNLYLLYLATIFLIIATPGPSILLIMQHSASYGVKRSFYNALGGVSAALILIILSLGGVALLIQGIWINVLSILGACLLVWIGFKNFKPIVLSEEGDHKESNKELFKTAFYTGISNPKDLIFFATLLPQFIITDLPYWQASLYLAFGWLVLDVSIMMSYALGAYLLAQKLSMGALNKTRAFSGVLLILIGGALLSSNAYQLV